MNYSFTICHNIMFNCATHHICNMQNQTDLLNCIHTVTNYVHFAHKTHVYICALGIYSIYTLSTYIFFCLFLAIKDHSDSE